MTIKEKAKAYDEAFKEAEKIHKFSSDIAEIKRMEQIFPELKESEDEKVRKGIIKYLSWIKDRDGSYMPNNIPFDDMIVWLEKQGKTSPILSNSSNIGKVEQKPAEWSEEDKDFMYDTLSNLTELKDRYGEGYGNVGKCIDWLKSLKQRIGG